MKEDNRNGASGGVVLASPIQWACPNPPDMGVVEKSGAKKKKKNQSVELLEIIEEDSEKWKNAIPRRWDYSRGTSHGASWCKNSCKTILQKSYQLTFRLI